MGQLPPERVAALMTEFAAAGRAPTERDLPSQIAGVMAELEEAREFGLSAFNSDAGFEVERLGDAVVRLAESVQAIMGLIVRGMGGQVLETVRPVQPLRFMPSWVLAELSDETRAWLAHLPQAILDSEHLRAEYVKLGSQARMNDQTLEELRASVHRAELLATEPSE